ncbi:MAG: GspH/FimT family pseudopilin [Gammaproteobacteria bacterium]
MQMARKYTVRTGYTLIEMLMTLVLIGILAAIAYPSYRAVMQNIRVDAITNDFMSSLSYARSEALKRDESISICAAADSSLTSCGNSTNWANGWIIFVDSDADGVIATSSDRLKTHNALDSGSLISSTLAAITYNRSGFLSAGIGSFTITVPGCSGNGAKLITLSATGRASITSTACTLP